MMELHVKAGCPACRRLEERLSEQAWAYQVVYHQTEPEQGPPAHAMVDSGQVVRGHEAVDHHIDELEKFAAEWQSFQSDVCVCRDESGEVI